MASHCPQMGREEEHFATGTARHRRGELAAAETLYREVLQANPEHAGATHYLGVIAYQRGQCAEAVAWIARAIALDGGQAAFHNNLGLALKALGRTAEAQAAYERALELRPEYPDAWSNLGIVLAEGGEVEAAIAVLRSGVAAAAAACGCAVQLRQRFDASGTHRPRRSPGTRRRRNCAAAGGRPQQPGQCPAGAAPVRRGGRALPDRLAS